MQDFIFRSLTSLLMVTLFLIAILYLHNYVIALILYGILGYVLAVEWPQFKKPYLTILYPVMPFLSLIFLNLQTYRLELLWLFSLIAAHDTGAYLVGKWCGHHKIMPTISPGKSWEGFIGGCLISYLISALFLHCAPASFSVRAFSSPAHVALVLSLNIFGVIGDLTESALKRSVRIKDSGTLLPGHGGILDRLDSMLFAVPAWLFIRLILHALTL